jgi:hypothetical protein
VNVKFLKKNCCYKIRTSLRVNPGPKYFCIRTGFDGSIFSAVVGRRADMSRTHEMELSREQTIRTRGVCEPALEPRGEWKGSRTRCQDFKPDLGNSAVRHYRGASENVVMAEL